MVAEPPVGGPSSEGLHETRTVDPPAHAEPPEPEVAVVAPPDAAPSDDTTLRLARLFHAETGTGTLAHMGVVVILVLFLWDLVGPSLLMAMGAAITLATAVRFTIHRSARTIHDDALLLLRRTRLATVLMAGTWGAVTLILAAVVPDEIWIRYLMAMAGIVAAATATHMADRPGFHLFTGFILGPVAVGAFFQGYGRNTFYDLVIVGAYWAMMALIHERAHGQLVKRLSTGSRLEAATRASTREKEFLDGVLESIPDAMALIDPDDRITRMNDEFRDTVVPATPHDGLTLGDVTGSGLGAVLASTVRTARRDGLGERECRTSADGGTRWFIATAARASGHAEGWVFLQLRDITSLRSAQEAQRKAEADLADMVESANDLIWRIDSRCRWTFLNAAAEEIYGVGRVDMLGTNALDLSADEHRDADADALRAIMDGGAMVNHVTVHERADGERRWMSFSGSPLRDDTEAVVGAHGIARDVTAEVKAREALEELARRNSLVRSLINASDDMIFYKDVDSVYRGSNDAFVELLGLPENHLVGRTDDELFPADLAEANRTMDAEVLERQAPIRYEANYDPDHPARVWETVVTPYVSDDGELLGVLGISREMTEWKQAQERIQRMAEEAERAAHMKSAFLANMSHEIRTPMNGVLGMSELLQDTELDGEQRQYVDVIRSSAENLLRILNDILDFSKIEAGRLELDSTPFDLHREVSDAVRVMAIQASRRGNELMVDFDADVPRWVEGDPGRLRQIITNLVGNAVKFTEDGEVEVGVRLMEDSGDAGAARIRMTVRDSGIGIAEDKLALIFQEFSQADASVSRRYGGTGLGLAISRRLVDLMGGEMQLASKEGEGSTFTFDVVLRPCDPPPEARLPADAGPVDLSDLRVLVVDDNHTNRRILRGVLGEAGATVHQADSGAAALHRLDELDASRTPPGLIVMDVQMPEMDGLQVIERLRNDPNHEQFSRIPILVLTSANRTEDARRVRELGVEGYFLKPLPRPDLLRAVAGIRADRTEKPDDDGARAGANLGAHLRRHRVLVVEDNPVNRMVACATLEKAGYRVEVATNGLEAVAAVRDDEFQLVLMDIQMPEMDGLEATRVIRDLEAEQERRRLPIIALTAHALEEERERCLGAGMDDFLAKPFRAEELLGLLERWTRPDDDEPDEAPPAEDPVYDPNPAAAPADAEPPVDLDGFRAVLEAAGIVEVFETTLQVFKADLPKRMEQIRDAWDSGDPQRVADAAHAIKSAAGNVQAHRLNALVAEMEAAGRDEDRARMESLWPQVTAELERVDTFLKEQ